MVKQWDDGMKRLFWAEPQDFVSWLLPGAEYVKKGLEEGREKGLEEGLEEGREQGREEGMLEGMRLSILDIVQARFPGIVDVVKKELDSIHDPTLLRRLTFKMSTAADAHEATRALFRIAQGEEE